MFPTPIAGLLRRRGRRLSLLGLDHGLQLHPDQLIVEVVDVPLQLAHLAGVPRLHLVQLGLRKGDCSMNHTK